MTAQIGKAKEIYLGEGFGDVALKVNGVRVEVRTDGSIFAFTNGPVKVSPLASAAPKIGDRMPDGTVFAGISPDTKKPMYAMQADAPLTYTFYEAKEYAAKLDAHGHQDWRVPTKAELKVLFENRNKGNLKGTFNETGSNPAGWYWSSTPVNDVSAWMRRFSDGVQFNNLYRDEATPLRCVR